MLCCVLRLHRLTVVYIGRQNQTKDESVVISYTMATIVDKVRLLQQVEKLTEENNGINDFMSRLTDILAAPHLRQQLFTIADALIGGCPVPTSSGGGGDTSDLRWDGRNPDEEEDAYRRRCIIAAVGAVINRNRIKGLRR